MSIYWLTGLPSSGKTTVAKALKAHIWDMDGRQSVVLDADDLRKTVNKNLGFSDEDRFRNVTNIARMARFVHDAGGIAIVACIAPLQSMREAALEIMGEFNSYWYFLKCGEAERIRRDSRGLYAAFSRGEIKGLTGMDAPYDPLLGGTTINTETIELGFVCQTIRYPHSWPRSVYIGRWSPFHNGHKAIIDKSVAAGEQVLVLVRRSHDDYSVGKRVEMIRAVYEDELSVCVEPFPDVKAVCIGRKVGYEVRRYDMPDDIEGISGTKVRAMIDAGDEAWRKFVPPEVAEVIG